MVLENFALEKFAIRENALEKVSYNRIIVFELLRTSRKMVKNTNIAILIEMEPFYYAPLRCTKS